MYKTNSKQFRHSLYAEALNVFNKGFHASICSAIHVAIHNMYGRGVDKPLITEELLNAYSYI